MKSRPPIPDSAGTPALLLQHLETLADTPDAIAKLRVLILDLAIRGALVPQDSEEGTAGELLKQIYHEKQSGLVLLC